MDNQVTTVTPVRKAALPVMIYPSSSYNNTTKIIPRNDLKVINNINVTNVKRTFHVEKNLAKPDVVNNPRVGNLSLVQVNKERYKALPIRWPLGKENEGFKIINTKNARILNATKSPFANITKLEKMIFQNAKIVNVECPRSSLNLADNQSKDSMKIKEDVCLFLNDRTSESDKDTEKINSKIDVLLVENFDRSEESDKYEDKEKEKAQKQTILDEDDFSVHIIDDLKSGIVNFNPPEYPQYFDDYNIENFFALSCEDRVSYDPKEVIIKNDISLKGTVTRCDLETFYYTNKIEAVLGERNITLPLDFSAALLLLQGVNVQPEPNETITNFYECDILSSIVEQNLLTPEEKQSYLKFYNSCKM